MKSSRRSRSGWTLIELGVVIFLASIVLLFVGAVLRAGTKYSRMQSVAAGQQARLRVSLRHLERVLANSRSSGVSFLDDTDAAVLAVHPFSKGDFDTGPVWEEYWSCFVWDKQKKELRLLDSDGLVPAPPRDETVAMMPDQLLSVASGFSSQNSRQLAQRVTDFQYSLEAGPFFSVQLEVGLPRNEHQAEDAVGRVRASRRFIPRN